jgi:hypothetical protein
MNLRQGLVALPSVVAICRYRAHECGRGPGGTATAEVRGDYYDMTRRRVVFEYLHKIGGYLVIVLATVDVVLGLRAAHALAWITVEHPGNRIPPIGWGIRRHNAAKPTPDSKEGH